MENAPVLLFTYKRLESLKQTVAALQQNFLALQSELYIFSDGAKKEQDVDQVHKVREYIKGVTGFKKIVIKEAEINKGLANSIIGGVSEIIAQSGRVIVLEDDLITTPNFLDFMNSALTAYETKRKIFSISGYSFDLGKDNKDRCDVYFLNRGWSWGWATWANRWNEVDWQVKDYSTFKLDKKKRREFAKGGTDLNVMLKRQMSGLLDSWAIRWFYYQYKVQGLTVYPLYSKVRNNGFDEYATHTTGNADRFKPMLDDNAPKHFNFPDEIVEHPFYQKQFQKKMGIMSRAKYKIQTILKNIFK